jgi:hypothetical protein
MKPVKIHFQTMEVFHAKYSISDSNIYKKFPQSPTPGLKNHVGKHSPKMQINLEIISTLPQAKNRPFIFHQVMLFLEILL